MERIFQEIAGKVAACLALCRIQSAGRIVVGLSGGKDSTTLMLALRELGWEVYPVVVDMGYEGFIAEDIVENAHQLGFRASVVSPRQTAVLHQLGQGEQQRITANLRELDSDDCVTPCGACSSTKRILLVAAANRLESNYIALGHHRDDLLATLLKDYWASQYYHNCGQYDRSRFIQFVSEKEIDFNYLSDLIKSQRASTIPLRSIAGAGIQLIRPLGLVPEDQIISFVADRRISVFGSGCSHAIFTEQNNVGFTKREIVHSDLHRRLRESPVLAETLLTMALQTLRFDGSALFPNPRTRRNDLLPGFDSERFSARQQ